MRILQRAGLKPQDIKTLPQYNDLLTTCVATPWHCRSSC